MPQLVELLLTNLAAIAAIMIALWVASLWLHDVSIVDVFWGAGFVLTAWTSWIMSDAKASRVLLLVVLLTIWGVRLTLYLLWRKWSEGEDRRYAAIREREGVRFWWSSLFIVFLLQGAIQWFVALPVQVAAWREDAVRLSWVDGFGAILWLMGFYFEAVGDWQMARFKRDPANLRRVMDRGLWRYTRHPNYFGDFCVWWGIYVIAAAGGAAATIASPILMSILLLNVSGVGLLESTIAARRPEYADYKSRTNAFIPGPPRRA